MPDAEASKSVTRGSRSGGGDSAGDKVAGQLAKMARSLRAEPAPEKVLQSIVDAAAENVPGADYAGITLVSKRDQVSTPANSDELVTEIDRLQATTQQGPCLSSAREHKTVRSDDLSGETRWPEFSSAAAEAGVLSMLCLQLFVEDDALGALNLYSREPHAFTDESEDIGLLLAAHAAVAMIAVQREGNLRAALSSRDVIGQAKGILMERHKIGGDLAFQLLIRASQDNNRKLAAIAEMVVTTGEDLTRANIRASA